MPAAAVELEDPPGDVVEEVPVVRDGDDRALVVGEEALEPRDRLGVEMVRRLVEQQQIRRREQQAAERDAAALAAGERLDVAVALGHAQRVHRVIDVLVELPRVGAVDRVLHLRLLGEQRVVVGVGLGERRRDLVEAVEQVAQRANAVLDVAAHVPLGVEPGLLLEQADASHSGASSATPDDGSSLPAMIRSTVDLPAPFGPSTPIFAPGKNDREMFASTCRSGP